MEARKGEETTTTPPITLEELKLQLYHPPPSQSPVFQNNSSNPSHSQSLSFIPWKLVPEVQEQTTTARVSSSGVATSPTPLSPAQAPPPSAPSPLSSSFPLDDYLDLRRQQNLAWAEDRLVQGNEQYYLDATKADDYYQEGLKLCPDHVQLLVAQAKLWIFRRNRPLAAKAQLEHCLRLEPNHSEAKDLLERWHRIDATRKGGLISPGHPHAHHYPSKGLPQMRETSSAFQNALMERNLALNSSTMLELDEEENHDHADDDNNNDEDDQDSNHHHRSNHKKKKKQKSKKKSKHGKKYDKKKKRRKRKRHDSSSSDEDSDDDDSISRDESARSSFEDTRKRRQGRHSRHHKRKRRVNQGESSPEDSTANNGHGHGMSNLNPDDGITKHSQDSLSSHRNLPQEGSHDDDDPKI